MEIVLIVPLLVLGTVAVAVFVGRVYSVGVRKAVSAALRTIIYGSLALFVLLIGWTVFYFATGGH